MTQVLVTGIRGFVGSRVARRLLARGRRVRALARGPLPAEHAELAGDVELVRGDLLDADLVARAVRGCDEVYHVAADYRFWAPDVREIYANNVRGTLHVLEAALGAGVGRFVHTSTVGTIGRAASGDVADESSPPAGGRAASHYKRSKIQAEQLALSYVERGLPVVVVNPSAPIGPGDVKPTPTGQLIVDFLRGDMPAFVATGLNFVHVDDVAEGHCLAAERGVVGRRYILGHQNLSMQGFLAALGAVVGRPPPRLRLPYWLAWAAGAASTGWSALSRRPPRVALEAVRTARHTMWFDPARAVAELGLPQTPIATALEEAALWFGQAGYLPALDPPPITLPQAANTMRGPL